MRPIQSPPRVLWYFLGGIVGLGAIYGLTLPPASSRPRSDSPAARVSKIIRRATTDSGEAKTSVLVGYTTPPRSLDAYSRLQHRNVFRPLVRSKETFAELEPASGKMDFNGTGMLPLVPPGFDGPATPQKSVGTWKYVGFSTVDGVPNAYLESTKDHQGRTTQVGDKVEGAMVVSVSQTGIRLMKGESAILLLRTDPLDATKPDKSKDATKTASNSPQPGNGAPPANGAPLPGGPQNHGPQGAMPVASPAPMPAPVILNEAPVMRAEKSAVLELRQ